MDKPFVIRTSQEDENSEKNETSDYMVDQVVSYFTHTDPEGHRKKWKKRKVKKTSIVDYYYV
jgi:hypothetical protein